MAWQERLGELNLSRRKLLTGAALGGGLLVAWWAWPRSYDPPLEPGEGEYGFGAWLTVGEDGVVAVAVPQLEMGQGVTTLLAQVVAVELGADWRQVAVIPAPPSGAHPNVPLAAKWAPLWASFPGIADDPDGFVPARFARREAFSATADGTALAAYEADAREAGAAARAMLAMAAAERWGVSWEECEVDSGFVTHGERRARFGELASLAAQMEPPDPPPLRAAPASEAPIAGEREAPSAYPRIDLPAKVDGSLLFAADVRLPGMVHASVRHGPVGLTELTSFDEAAAARIPGVLGVVKARRWIAAVAESWWQADRALSVMRPRFAGPGAVDSATIDEQLDDALADGEADRIAEIGDPDTVLQQPALTRRYDIAPALHASIETSSATAHLVDGQLHLWLASQAPEAARKAAAKAIGLSVLDVVLYPVAAGGSFDARLERQHAIEVAQIAKEIGRPVQLTWPRLEESKIVPPRTPVSIELSAALSSDDQRALMGWGARIACPATVREFGHRLFENKTPEAAIRLASGEGDPLACEGAVPPYRIPNLAVDHVPTELFLPTGRLRGNAPAYTGFATECFVDEAASEARRDPLLYRLAMLGRDVRTANVLRRAGRLGGWDGGRAGSGQGIAVIRMDAHGDEPAEDGADGGGRIGCVANARLGDGGIEVSRLTAVVDIGRIVNLDIARQQVEGGLIFGLGLATGSSPQWRNGRPEPGGLAGMNIPSLADAPEIVVEFVESDAAPFDPGELGVAVAPPAIANALFAGTGRRFRTLPLSMGAE